jgi:hypothetical protein
MKTGCPSKLNSIDIKSSNWIVQAEGIFRITAGNSQEEYVRDQLNGGVIPDGIDVRCLAGLIKVQCGFFFITFVP